MVQLFLSGRRVQEPRKQIFFCVCVIFFLISHLLKLLRDQFWSLGWSMALMRGPLESRQHITAIDQCVTGKFHFGPKGLWVLGNHPVGLSSSFWKVDPSPLFLPCLQFLLVILGGGGSLFSMFVTNLALLRSQQKLAKLARWLPPLA